MDILPTGNGVSVKGVAFNSYSCFIPIWLVVKNLIEFSFSSLALQGREEINLPPFQL